MEKRIDLADKELLVNIIHYYVFMGRWLYQIGDYTRTRYLYENLQPHGLRRSLDRPVEEYAYILQKYYNGSTLILARSIEAKKAKGEELLRQLFSLSRTMELEPYHDLINPILGTRETPDFVDDNCLTQNLTILYSMVCLNSRERRRNARDIVNNILKGILKLLDHEVEMLNEEIIIQLFTEPEIYRAASILSKIFKNQDNSTLTVDWIILIDRLKGHLYNPKTFYSLEKNFRSSMQRILSRAV